MSAKVEAARHFKAEVWNWHSVIIRNILFWIQGKRIAQEDENQNTDSSGTTNGTDHYMA